MIIVTIAMCVLPEKQLEFTQTLHSIIEPTKNEQGCLNYEIFCDIRDKNCFILLEEWQTREDLDRHIRSHRFSVLLGSKSLLCKPIIIKIFTISATEGMETVNLIRENKHDELNKSGSTFWGFR